MTVKALAVGVALVLAPLFSPAHADDGNGRYTIVPIPGHNGVILLDTRTGQNWFSGDAVELKYEHIYAKKITNKTTFKTFNWRPNLFSSWTETTYEKTMRSDDGVEIQLGRDLEGNEKTYLPSIPNLGRLQK